ncbi:hypothetical protein M0R45_006801 [Rubus argutus]|uniref:Uncharacterized protein n=1 Tax=Rubus argutus TaxID=59490 RepID=A0AAW1YRS6_RUBAR
MVQRQRARRRRSLGESEMGWRLEEWRRSKSTAEQVKWLDWARLNHGGDNSKIGDLGCWRRWEDGSGVDGVRVLW